MNITFLSLYQSIPYEAYKGILFVHRSIFLLTKILIISYKLSSILF